jgi:hypothetical protein
MNILYCYLTSVCHYAIQPYCLMGLTITKVCFQDVHDLNPLVLLKRPLNNDFLVPQTSTKNYELQTQHLTTARMKQSLTETYQPTQLRLLTNSTGLSLACPSPASATSSLTLPPLAATTVLLLLSPLCFGVLQGVVPTSPNNSPSSSSPFDLGVLILQLYSEELVGYRGDTIVVVVEVL